MRTRSRWPISSTPRPKGSAHRAGPLPERHVDVAFIARGWQRPLKNYAVVQQIVHASPGLTVHIVGDAANPLMQATHHGVLRRRADVYALLGRCKAVVCPSPLDAAPGILFKAS